MTLSSRRAAARLIAAAGFALAPCSKSWLPNEMPPFRGISSATRFRMR